MTILISLSIDEASRTVPCIQDVDIGYSSTDCACTVAYGIALVAHSRCTYSAVLFHSTALRCAVLHCAALYYSAVRYSEDNPLCFGFASRRYPILSEITLEYVQQDLVSCPNKAYLHVLAPEG